MKNHSANEKRRSTPDESRSSITRKPIVFFFLLFFFLRRTTGYVKGESTSFRQVTVSASRLTTANQSFSFKTFGHLSCAAKAAQKDWVLLMCYAQEMCNLYDIPIPSTQEDGASDAMVCYTKLLKDCVVNEAVVPNGETVVSNCAKMECRAGILSSISTADVDLFHDAGPLVGCIHLHEIAKTWDAARTSCQGNGGDLFVAQDFLAFRNYIANNARSDNWYWVGIRGNVWLDGGLIPEGDWAPDEPDFADQCGVVHRDTGGGLLFDGTCAQINHYSVCQYR